jgi:hypothetical protein
MGFADSIEKWGQKALTEANASICKRAESLFTNVVVLSPEPPGKGGYSKGVIKGGWYSAINGFNNTVNTAPDPSGISSLSRIKSTLAAMPFFGKDATVTLTNSTPYIRYVEFIGWPANYPGNNTGWKWTGKIGPYSMVSTAVSNFRGAYG